MDVSNAPMNAPARRTSTLDLNRSPLPYYGFRLGEALCAVVPRSVAYALAGFAAQFIVVANPAALDHLRANLRHVFPHASERVIRKLARANARNVARCWVDVMAMRYRAHETKQRLRTVHLERYHKAVARGCGVVIVSMHFGAWEEGIASWSGSGGGKISLLAELLQPKKFFDRVVGARGTLGVDVIPIDVAGMRHAQASERRRLGAAAMREVMRVLRSGGVVAIALDRDLANNGEPVDFFGAPAPIPVGVVDVAMRAGAAIVPVLLVRRPWGVEGIIYDEVPYDRDANQADERRRVCRDVLGTFEPAIREHPDQWHVLDAVWDAA